MAKHAEVRKYRMSDGTLIQLADDIMDSAQRDMVALADYGVTAATIDEMSAVRAEFWNTPTDEQLSGKMIGATADKNEARKTLLIKIRQMGERVRIKFGEGHKIYREFGIEALTKQTDSDLARIGKRVYDLSAEYFAELESEGLSTTKLDDLLLNVESFDNLINLQYRAIKNRDFAVDTRIRIGNNLYEMVIALAAKGKICWVEENEALYNDYIISESRSSAGHVTTGSVAANSVVNISITGVDAATTITFENTGNGPLLFYFSANPLDPTGPFVRSIPAGATEVHPATALGYDELNNITRFNVNNTNATAGGYRVEWI